MGSYLIYGNGLSKETHMLTRDFVGNGYPGRQQEGKGIQENALPCGSASGFLLIGLVFGCLWLIIMLGPESNSKVIPGGT